MRFILKPHLVMNWGTTLDWRIWPGLCISTGVALLVTACMIIVDLKIQCKTNFKEGVFRGQDTIIYEAKKAGCLKLEKVCDNDGKYVFTRRLWHGKQGN